MAFGPNLFNGQLTTQNSPELVPPPSLGSQEEDLFSLAGEDTIAQEIGSLAGRTRPAKAIQLNQFNISRDAMFVSRKGEQVMPNDNPESFIRQGGLIVDGPSVYIDSLEQTQIPSANLRGALIRMVQSGVGSIAVRTFTGDRVYSPKELIKRRFRLI